VLVQRDHLGLDLVVRQKTARVPRIFRSHDRGAAQDIERTQRNIP
jgi:hypothetical protein